MLTLAAAILSTCLQPAPLCDGVAAIVGTWTSTVQPRSGEAPAMFSSFTVNLVGEQVTVVVAGTKDRIPANVFQSEKGQCVLVLKVPDSRAGTRTVIIRPIAKHQVRVEVFVERQLRGRADNFYYAEVFKQIQ